MQQRRHSGRKHTHWYGFWRFPRTTQEKRAAQDGWARAKRSVRNLPDAQNEYITFQSRGWKDYRYKQYKGG